MTRIIAELSSNHNGDLCRCLDMIAAAKICGCWAAKFQLFKPEDLPDFEPANIVTPLGWLPHLFTFARAHQIEIFASVFAPWAVTALNSHDCKYFKIASPGGPNLGEERYRAIARKIPYGRETFVSSDQKHFGSVWGIFRGTMLYCKPGYPNTLDADDIAFAAKNAKGYSDHTVGIMQTLAMVGAGAEYIEKHFKLDDNCADAEFSINPDQMKMLCDLCS